MISDKHSVVSEGVSRFCVSAALRFLCSLNFISLTTPFLRFFDNKVYVFCTCILKIDFL